MAEPSEQDRMTARQHTAQLLKMLRGAGSEASPPVAANGMPAERLAEAPSSYAVARQRSTEPRAAAVAAKRSAPASPPLPCPPRPIPVIGDGLRQQEGVLGMLMARADRLAQLTRILHAYLPAHLRDHAVLLRLDAEAWTVQTDSPAWATRLRYALYNIRPTLGRHLQLELPKPRIRVAPAAEPVPVLRPRPTLTADSARLLEVTAGNVFDSRLSAALRKLAAHAGPTASGPDAPPG